MAMQGRKVEAGPQGDEPEQLRVYLPRQFNAVKAAPRPEPPDLVFIPPEDNLIEHRALIRRMIRQKERERQRRIKKRMKAAEEIEIQRQLELLEALPPELQEKKDQRKITIEVDDENRINIGNLVISYATAAQIVKAWIMMDED